MTRKVKGENGYAPVGNELKELQAQVAANSKAIEDLQETAGEFRALKLSELAAGITIAYKA